MHSHAKSDLVGFSKESPATSQQRWRQAANGDYRTTEGVAVVVAANSLETPESNPLLLCGGFGRRKGVSKPKLTRIEPRVAV